MDYEKLYKEALERAKKLYEQGTITESLNYIFPELKEMDELTWLTKYIEEEAYYLSIDIRDEEDRIKLKNLKRSLAWLEKQGEQYVPSKEMILNVWELGNIWKEITKGICNSEHGTQLDYILKHWTEGEYYTEWLEKQGESIRIKKGKNYLCTKTHKYAGMEWIEGVKYYSPENYSLVNQGCTCYCPKYSKEEHNNFFKEVEYDGCLEVDNLEPKFKVKYAVGEYNVVDEKDIAGVTFYGIEDEPNHIDYVKADTYEIINAKLKFKVGDWVVFNDKHESIYQIEKIENFQYTLRHILGGSMHLSFSNEDMIRLWSINDAKDGDVLCGFPYADCPWVGIFHELNDDCTFNSYCYLQAGVNGKFCPPSGINVYGHSTKSIVPATKEQRDLLFQKMKEAGYVWDADEKKLINHNKI